MARVQTEMSISGVQQVVAGFNKAGSAAKLYGTSVTDASSKSAQAGSSLSRASSYVAQHSQSLNAAGSAMMKAGALVAGGLAATAKAAMDWESEWAGVTKTVNGTPEQMAALEQQLRGLTSVLPASHEEIAGVAEAAGQLGIERQNVASFTQTMVEMGESTNLSADDAATSIAQMMNIMGTAQGNASRLGSTIVALGNNGASTERDITEMGLRISAAGKQVGMSETDVLGFANALASTGVEAEAGGTAISMTFKQIDGAVRKGGAALDEIAATSGMTSAQFKSAWGTNAAGAMNSFVVGLGKAQASGKDVNATLADLGMTGVRQTDSLLRLASATKAAGGQTDLLADSLKMAKTAWTQDIALNQEAAKRHATTASQAKIAWNTIKDSAISGGQSLLPTLATVAAGVSHVAQAFGGLPAPVRQFSVSLAAVSSGSLLAVGGLLKVVTKAVEVKNSLAGLGVSMKAASLSMGLIGVAVMGASMALGAWMAKQQRAKEAVDSYTTALQGQTKAVNEASTQVAAKALQDAGAFDAAKKLGLSIGTVTQAALGNKDAMAQVTKATSGAYEALAKYTQANADELGSNLNTDENKRLTDKTKAAKTLLDAIHDQNDAFSTAVEKQKQLSDATAAASGADANNAAQKKKVAEASQEAAQAIDDLIKSTQSYGNTLLELSGNQIGVEAAIDDATKSLKENGKTLDINTEKGRNNQTALNNIASSSMAYIKTMAEAGASTEDMTDAVAKGKNAYIQTAQAMGMSKAEAQSLAEAYFAIPKTAETTVDTKLSGATTEQIDDLHAKIAGLPKSKQTEILAIAEKKGIDEANVAIAKALAQNGKSTSIKTSAPGAGTVITQFAGIDGKWKVLNGKTVAMVTSAPGAVGTYAQLDGVWVQWRRINGRVVAVKTSAPGAGGAAADVSRLNQIADKTNHKHVVVTATADTSSARSKIQSLTGVQGHATIIVNAVTGSTPRSLTSHIASANANGNLYERHQAQIAKAGSWRVWAEPETGGEAYIPLAASKRGRSRMIAAATVQKLGGDVQWFANGSSLTGAQSRAVQAKIVITADATASLRSTSNAAASALRNLQTVTRQTAPALKSTNAAFANYPKANTRANQLRDQKARYDAAMNVQISKASKTRAKALRTSKARTDARYAQRITAAKQRAAALKKVYDARAKASKAASDKLKAAQAKLTEANKTAADAQKELADSAAQAGKSLSDGFRAGGSVTDWVSAMKEGASNLTAFNSRLLQLRRLGLSQANIDTLVGMGSAQGSEMAAEILKGGKNSVAALNKASNSLDAIAKNLGLTTITAHASGAVHDATISSVPLFAEAGPEAFIPFNGSTRSREIWLESGRRLGVLPMADGGAYVRRSSSATPLATIPAPVVQIDRLVLDVPGIGTAIDARVKSIQTSTARNITRGAR